MKAVVIIIWIGLSAGAVSAQDGDLVRLRQGDDFKKSIPFTKRYKYDPFLGGHAIYANGKTSAHFRFNYDYLYGEMQLINRRSDTLYVVNDDGLKYLFIGNDIFYHDFRRGYFQLLAEAHSVRLAVQQLLSKKRRESSVSNGYAQFIDYTSAGWTSWGSDDVLMENKALYYLIDDNEFIRKFNKKNLLKVFDKHQETLESYLAENEINFRKEEDLKRLFQFCSSLP